MNENLKNDNIKVALSGQGGDELFMGYLKYYFYLMKEKLSSLEFLDFIKLSILQKGQFSSNLIFLILKDTDFHIIQIKILQVYLIFMNEE